MKKAPKNYNTDQIFNDIIYLGHYTKDLSDSIQCILGYLKEQYATEQFMIIEILKLGIEQIKLGKKPGYPSFDRRLKALEENLDGMTIHYSSTLKEINTLSKKMVDKQDTKYTIK